MTLHDNQLNTRVLALAERLLSEQLSLTVAESCTGGWLAKVCTDLAGSSRWFERGFVTYSNEAKHELLQVPMDLIVAHGAVSEPVALVMAKGALAHSHADIALAITGIAGPDGGSAEKPVGTVWFAVAGREGVRADRQVFPGERDAVRFAAVCHALDLLLEVATKK